MEEIEKIKSLLNLKNCSDEDLNLIADFFLNNQNYRKLSLDDKEILERKNKLEKIYMNLITKEQEKISEYNEIKKIIVMVSYADIVDIENILFELPIEKSMRIFPNLDTIYLLYTSGTKASFNNISQKLNSISNKNKPIKIIGEEIENTLESIYPYLKELVRKGKISKNDTVLDLTTGMKISGIALYKLAVERGIKIINWKEEFIELPKKPNEKPKNIRNPFSVCLEILKEPIKESSKNYESINLALKNKEYSSVSNLFNIIGDEDKAFLFEKIDKIFSLGFILSSEPDSFFQELKNVVNEIVAYKNFTADTKMKMQNFLSLISVLAFYEEEELEEDSEEDSNNNDSWRNKIVKLIGSNIDLTISDMIECCYSPDENLFDKDIIYDYIFLNILDNKFKSDNNEFVNKKLLQFISPFITINKKSKSIKDEINSLLNKDIQKKLDKALDLENAFKVDIKKTIYIKNGILTIEKFNLNIELTKYKTSKYFINFNTKNLNSIYGQLLMKTLESTNYQLSKNNFSNITVKSDNERILYKVKSELISNLNKIIDEELEKIGKEPKKFLIINSKSTGNDFIIINEDFYI